MSEAVKIIECPRDAWQGLHGQIPTDLKVDYLKALLSAGFRHIDAASFVSAKAVPQMADSADVLREIDLPDDVEIISIVVNEKGAQRAIETEKVHTLGFPYSVSPTFLHNNQRQTPEESLEQLENIQKKADDAGLDVVVYISMAFGNPYGDAYDAEEVVAAVDVLESSGIKMISLADTVGVASPDQVRTLVSAVTDKFGYLEIGVHLHSRPNQARDKIIAAYEAGCRRFDSALAGLGGCPFAQDLLVGNVPTEILLDTLRERGAELPPLKSLDALLRASTEIGARYTSSHAAD
ncbi:MAG TPA: hydroxymethylglutaryl-CoA lyase [Terriglobales bacterium]|nr:hydroxymethylglutaryl-CoA lyase [Terriglobales bacterium]